MTQPVEAGVAGVVTALIGDQTARGWDVHLACPPSRLADQSALSGATVWAWPATRAPGPASIGEMIRVAGIAREVRPDVVHLHSAKAGLAGRLAVRGALPTIYQPHAWSFEAAATPWRQLVVKWERVAAECADLVMCVSAAERELALAAGIDARWAIAPNGVDTDRFRPDDQPRARSSLGLTSEPIVTCIGRLCKQKGQDVLLEAWQTIRRRVPSARLVLVGDGPERLGLQELAGDGVVFAGATDDVVPYLSAADVVVVCSRWEGMSLSVLEAMACGRPIVATEVAGNREALGDTGVIVPNEAPEAVADAVTELLFDPARANDYGRRARDRALAHHDIAVACARVAQQTAELALEVDAATTGRAA